MEGRKMFRMLMLVTGMFLVVGPVIPKGLVSATTELDVSSEVYILCNTQKYGNENVFSDEVSRVLAALEKKAAATTASSSYYGSSEEGSVLGAYQCRGDIPAATCSKCVREAAQSAVDNCPNAIGSRVQLDGCFVRYENYSFVQEDASVVTELCNTQKDNSTLLESTVGRLLNKVTAAAPKDKRLFASASSSLGGSSHLYALAQCLGYLSAPECSDCLTAHISAWQDCDHAVGAQVHSVSCYYRFEMYPFYYID